MAGPHLVDLLRDGCLDRRHLLLQLFMAQGRRGSAAVQGLLGQRAALLPGRVAGGGAGGHQAGRARGEVLLAGCQVLVGAAVRRIAAGDVLCAAWGAGAAGPGEVDVLHAAVPNVDPHGLPVSHHRPDVHAGVWPTLRWPTLTGSGVSGVCVDPSVVT